MVTGFKQRLVELAIFRRFIADKVSATDHTGFAKPVGHNSGMGSYSAPCRQKTVGCIYFPDIIGNGITPDKNEERVRLLGPPAIDFLQTENDAPAHSPAADPDTVP